MITGVFLRGVKSYRTISFVPLSVGDPFCSLLGANGIGKSAILEALDWLFNGGPLNRNHHSIKDTQAFPFVVPVLLVKKKALLAWSKADSWTSALDQLSEFSDAIWDAEVSDFNSSQRGIFGEFLGYREKLSTQFEQSEYLLLPIGENLNGDTYSSIFGDIFEKFVSKDAAKRYLTFLRGYYTYLYVPAEIDVTDFARLEGVALQKLSGKSIESEIRKIFTQDIIKGLNAEFKKLVDQIEETLEGYVYRKDGQRQSNITFSDLYDRLIESYFAKRKLTRQGEVMIPVSKASSGEKRKALIDLCYAFMKDAKQQDRSRGKVIIAIDEPELSLDMCSVFDQFEKLFSISRMNVQTLAATHWYGFLPALPRGGVVNITPAPKKASKREFIFLDLESYRDSLRSEGERLSKNFKPDISLKSRLDLVQSIMASLRRKDSDKWILCEGYSDKIYLEYFFDRYTDVAPKILPIGGWRKVIELFDYLGAPVKEEKSELQGKVLCIIDTDEKSCDNRRADIGGHLMLRRFGQADNDGLLLQGNSDVTYPPTEIEDILQVEPFFDALQEAADEDQFSIVEDYFDLGDDYDESCVAPSLDLGPAKRDQLLACYSTGSLKVDLAKHYIGYHDELDFEPSDWFVQLAEALDVELVSS